MSLLYLLNELLSELPLHNSSIEKPIIKPLIDKKLLIELPSYETFL